MKNIGENKKVIHLQVFVSPQCAGGSCPPDCGEDAVEMTNTINEVVAQHKGQITGEYINIFHPLVRTHHLDVIKQLRQHGLLILPILKINGQTIANLQTFNREQFIDVIEKELKA